MRMSVTTTSAPARASARQSALPRPRDPPVTTATLPVSSNMQRSSLAGDARLVSLATEPAALASARGGDRDRGVLDDLRPRGRCPLAEDVAADHQALDFSGAFPDLVDLG